MDILSAAEISDIQSQIAPEAGDELVSMIEVWRMPGTPIGSTPPAGGAGVDEYGLPVEGNAAPEAPTQLRAKVAEYPARVSRVGAGKEDDFAGQAVSVKAYQLSFNWADNPDIRGGDKLIVKKDEWTPNTAFAVGDLVQPTASNGRYYRATVAGTTGASEPVWPTAAKGDTVADGGVTWEYFDKLRTFEVVDPGGETTYKVVRIVRVEEIKA